VSFWSVYLHEKLYLCFSHLVSNGTLVQFGFWFHFGVFYYQNTRFWFCKKLFVVGMVWFEGLMVVSLVPKHSIEVAAMFRRRVAVGKDEQTPVTQTKLEKNTKGEFHK